MLEDSIDEESEPEPQCRPMPLTPTSSASFSASKDTALRTGDCAGELVTPCIIIKTILGHPEIFHRLFWVFPNDLGTVHKVYHRP